MTKDVERTMGVILREFEIIKSSLKPVVEEVKKSKETKIELERTKRDLEARIKKMEFEIRRLSQRPEISRDVSVLSDKLKKLQNDLSGIKSTSGASTAETKKVLKAIVSEEEFLTDVQKSSIARLKKRIDELDKNHLKLISSTREKTAGILTELSKSNEHKEQIVSELNKHKAAILKLKEENKKLSEKLNNISAINSRIEKKQAAEAGDIKNRMHKLDKKMMTQQDLNELKTTLSALKEKVLGEVGSLKHQFGILEKKTITKREMDAAVKSSIKTENVAIETAVKNIRELIKSESSAATEKLQKNKSEISKEVELLKNNLSEVVKAMDGISIKVENTSKIITEMEKVL